MIKPIKTTNRLARNYVRDRVPFTNSNNQLFARWASPQLYVVYSYGEHWPLFIYSTDTASWYGNEDRYSPTTSHHRGYTHPHTKTKLRSATWMRKAASGTSTAFILLSECEEA